VSGWKEAAQVLHTKFRTCSHPGAFSDGRLPHHSNKRELLTHCGRNFARRSTIGDAGQLTPSSAHDTRPSPGGRAVNLQGKLAHVSTPCHE
jgi:hypothetical protein